MNKLVNITVGNVVWVGIRYTNRDGVEVTQKLYPSRYVGECGRYAGESRVWH